MSGLSSWELCVKYALFIFNFVFWAVTLNVSPGSKVQVKSFQLVSKEPVRPLPQLPPAPAPPPPPAPPLPKHSQLAGTGVLAVGLWLRFDSRTAGLFEGEDAPTAFFTGVYILIAAGAVMMVVGFLGCCGAIKESPCMLGLFFLFLLLIFALEVAAGIWGLSNKDRVIEDVTEFYKQTYSTYQQHRQEALKETLRLIHFGLDCCGPTGTVFAAAQETCPKKEGLDVLITRSCPVAIDEMFNNKLHIVGGVGIGIGVIMIFGMIFSMMLCCAIKKSRDFV